MPAKQTNILQSPTGRSGVERLHISRSQKSTADKMCLREWKKTLVSPYLVSSTNSCAQVKERGGRDLG